MSNMYKILKKGACFYMFSSIKKFISKVKCVNNCCKECGLKKDIENINNDNQSAKEEVIEENDEKK